MFGKKLLVAVAVSILLLAGCQPVSVEDAKAQLCADLDQFKAALDGVDALTADSTIEDAEEAFEVADDAWDDVVHSARIVNNANYDNLDQAYEDLDDAIRQIDSGDTLQGASDEVHAQLDVVNAAYDEFYNLQCPR